MKLFTEEEVRKVISEAMFYHDTVDAHISKMTPIELPSDEEIEKQAIWYDNQVLSETPPYHFFNGAKWVIDKIKNQQ